MTIEHPENLKSVPWRLKGELVLEVVDPLDVVRQSDNCGQKGASSRYKSLGPHQGFNVAGE
jgi:hypothetical protein